MGLCIYLRLEAFCTVVAVAVLLDTPVKISSCLSRSTLESLESLMKESPLKFGIWQLMVVTAFAAVLCAFLARIVQRLPKESQTAGALFVVAILGGMLVYVAVRFVLWSQLHQRAGARELLTAGATMWIHHIMGIFFCAVSLFQMALAILTLSSDSNKISSWASLLNLCVPSALALNYLMDLFVWKVDKNGVDVRENGLILGNWHFLPWSSVSGFRWNKFTNKLMLLGSGAIVECGVPEDHKDALAAALEKHVPFQEEGF